MDRIGLRVTPAVFAVVFALGAWGDPVDLFGLPFGWLTRAAFTVAAATSVAAAVRPRTDRRVVALLTGVAATVSRGLTIVVIGQPVVPRKSEIIGGSVWVTVGWLVFAVWILTVPAAERWCRR